MVVDDEKDILRIIQLYLKKWGFDVEPFDNPFEALEAFRERPSAFSLVLSDIRMPGMDGIQLAKEIIKIKQDAKVVMMTAFELDEQISSSLPNTKKEDILRKPLRLVDICTAVKKRLAITN
jgi:DNA-binding NtrC family response regulator